MQPRNSSTWTCAILSFRHHLERVWQSAISQALVQHPNALGRATSADTAQYETYALEPLQVWPFCMRNVGPGARFRFGSRRLLTRAFAYPSKTHCVKKCATATSCCNVQSHLLLPVQLVMAMPAASALKRAPPCASLSALAESCRN